jgi:hypothetical protein
MRFEIHDYYSYRIRNVGLLELQVLLRWSVRFEIWGHFMYRTSNIGLLELKN